MKLYDLVLALQLVLIEILVQLQRRAVQSFPDFLPKNRFSLLRIFMYILNSVSGQIVDIGNTSRRIILFFLFFSLLFDRIILMMLHYGLLQRLSDYFLIELIVVFVVRSCLIYMDHIAKVCFGLRFILLLRSLILRAKIIISYICFRKGIIFLCQGVPWI